MEAILKSRQVPNVPVNFVPAKAGEIIKLGPIICRVLEDGSRTGHLNPISKLPEGHGKC